MKFDLQPPANWQTFEDICFRLWKSIWGDANSHPNGRSGQTQNGVDIYGLNHHKETVGVQCKKKTKGAGSKLSNAEIDNECLKAKKFSPPLNQFIMATTMQRDAKIQKYCRELTKNRKYGFDVDCWAWQDISEELQCRPDLMDLFYPNIPPSTNSNNIKISVVETSNKLSAFFSRPGIFNAIDNDKVDLLELITTELALNAFEHGNASTVDICIDGDILTITDDGRMFDPTTLLSNDNQRGGELTLKKAAEYFDIQYKADRANKLCNVTTLKDKAETSIAVDPNRKIYISINAADIFGRNVAKNIISAKLREVPVDSTYVVFDIFGKINYSISLSFEFIESISCGIPTGAKARLLFPPIEILKEELKRKAANYANIEIIFKQ